MILIVDPISNDLGHHYHYNKMTYNLISTIYQKNIKFMSSYTIVKHVKEGVYKEDDILKSINKKGFFSKITNRINIFQNYKRILDVAKRYKSQSIIFTGVEEISFYLFYVLNRRKFDDIKVGIILHNNIANALSNNVKEFFLRKTVAIVDTCIVHEEFQKKILVEIMGEHILLRKIVILKNIIEKKTDIKQLGSPVKIYFLGNTAKYKDLGTVLKAIDELPQKLFNYIKVGIYGEISSEFEKKICKVKDKISIKNQHLTEEEYSNYLKEANFIVLPYTPTFKGRISGIFYDAMSFQVPVICSDIDVYKFYFDKFGEIGFKFKPKSSKEIADIFMKISNLESMQYLAMQNRIKNLAKEYSEEKVISNMTDVIENILNGG